MSDIFVCEKIDYSLYCVFLSVCTQKVEGVWKWIYFPLHFSRYYLVSRYINSGVQKIEINFCTIKVRFRKPIYQFYPERTILFGNTKRMPESHLPVLSVNSFCMICVARTRKYARVTKCRRWLYEDILVLYLCVCIKCMMCVCTKVCV